jgi:hypothetical protein
MNRSVIGGNRLPVESRSAGDTIFVVYRPVDEVERL